MVKKHDGTDVTLYVCERCGLSYEEEKWAVKCETWCSEHEGTWNYQISKHAVGVREGKSC